MGKKQSGMAVDLSVVIVSFNVRELLRGCLASVSQSSVLSPQSQAGTYGLGLQTSDLGLETIVVDNASADGSAVMVQQEFPAVQLIVNAQNRGYAAANNQGLRAARGRYVLLLNPDTVILDDALANLVRFLDEHPRAGAVGGRLVNADGSFQHGAFRFPTLTMTLLDFFPRHRLLDSALNGRYPRAWYDHAFPIDHPLGACLAVRRETLAQVGLLDEGFFMYCEEVDWCQRIKRAGWEIWYVPDAPVIHYAAQSTRQFRYPMFVELWKSRYRLFAKHRPAWWQAINRQLVRLGLWAEARRARAAQRRGEISEQELADRLAAYRQVARL